MSKFCTNCGKELEDSANVCSNCGTPVNGTVFNQQVNNYNYNYNNNNVNIQKREIATCIILSILTCGIYGIYWFICLTDDTNKICNNEKTASGGVAFLLSLVTCGIYTFYWNYMAGKRMYEAGKKYGIAVADNSVLYLILSIFGLGIVNYCLIQNDLNKFTNE